MKGFPLTLKKKKILLTGPFVGIHVFILPSATVSPSGTQDWRWWSCPSCISVLERIPGSTFPQTIPFSLSALASSRPSVTTLRSQNYNGYQRTIFCCRHFWEGLCNTPLACCTFTLNPGIFYKLALRKVSTKLQPSFDENTRRKNITMLANEP